MTWKTVHNAANKGTCTNLLQCPFKLFEQTTALSLLIPGITAVYGALSGSFVKDESRMQFFVVGSKKLDRVSACFIANIAERRELSFSPAT